MRKSSINFEPANGHNFKHNDRSEKEPSYLLLEEYRKGNDVSHSADEVAIHLEALTNRAKRNYFKTIGQKLQAKKYVWEGAVNLEAHHTIEDVEKLAKAIEEDTGFTSLQISIHRDEGHINKRGYPVYNYHAHISFFTLDKKTGQQLWRRQITKKQKERQPDLRPMNRERLSKFQDLTAEILGMKRGKKGSAEKHIKPALFRELKKKDDRIAELCSEVTYLELEGMPYEVENRTFSIEEELYSEVRMLKNDIIELKELLGNTSSPEPAPPPPAPAPSPFGW